MITVPAARSRHELQTFVESIAGVAEPESRFSMNVYFPSADGVSGGTMIDLTDDVAPDAGVGTAFGVMINQLWSELGLDLGVLVVRGVPLPTWARVFYKEFEAALVFDPCRFNLIGVEGCDWTSFHATT